MDTKQYLENAAKLISLLSETSKFLVLAALSAFAIAAITQPAWARQKLKEAGLSVKEINAFGVKLAADDGFDMAQSVSDARLQLQALQEKAGDEAGKRPEALKVALSELEKVSATLERQNSRLRSVQESAGITPPPIPESGWLYVGRIGEDGRWTLGPRIDAARSRLESGKVRQIQITVETPVLRDGESCVRKSIDEMHPPTEAELQTVQVLLKPNPSRPLDVLETASCPSIGNGKWVYAKVVIRKDDVSLVKYGTLLGQ